MWFVVLFVADEGVLLNGTPTSRSGLSKMVVNLKSVVLNGSPMSPESDGCPVYYAGAMRITGV
jgi:hypothetical protein